MSTRTPLRQTGSVLVVESDEMTTRAAVCRAKDGHCEIVAFAESNRSNLGQALDELLPKLSAQKAKLPKAAVLMTSQVHTAELLLPVDPKKPPPFQQFQELLHWEIEPYMARRRVRGFDSILIDRGYLKPVDLENLLSQTVSSEDAKTRRLGDAALEAGLITRDQLAECLALQQAPAAADGAIVCGWRPLDSQTEGGKWHWLVSAMGDRLRQEARALFAARGLRMSGAYPLVGGACAALNAASAEQCAIFDYRAGQLSYVRCEHQKVVNARTVFPQEATNPLRACRDLFEARAQNVWLAGRWPDLAAARIDLEATLGRPCQSIASFQSTVKGPELPAVAGMVGTALHYFNGATLCSVASVPARDPRPPIRRNPFLLAGVAGILVAVGLFVGAGFLGVRTARLAVVLDATKQLADAQAQGARINNESQQTELAIVNLRESLQRKRKRIEELLVGLQTRTSNEIMIQSIQATPTGDIDVHGWGLTPQGIQVFIVNLQAELRELTLVESGKPIRQERGWHSLSGYSFDIHLSPGGSVEKHL